MTPAPRVGEQYEQKSFNASRHCWCSRLIFHLPACAEDIDLFVGSAQRGGNTERADHPGQHGELEYRLSRTRKCRWSMCSADCLTDADKFRIGLMMFTETGNGNSGNDGAYVRAATRPDQQLPTRLSTRTWSTAWTLRATSRTAARLPWPWWRRTTTSAGERRTPATTRTRPTTPAIRTATPIDDVVHAFTGNALTSKTATTYNSPVGFGRAVSRTTSSTSATARPRTTTADITVATSALGCRGRQRQPPSR